MRASARRRLYWSALHPLTPEGSPETASSPQPVAGMPGPSVGLGTIPAMPSDDQAELRLTGSRDDAVDAIVAALPKDAVVRNEEDGVGRFAGERTLVIVGAGKERLMLFRGTWGSMKARLEKPQLEVVLEARGDGVAAKITREPETAPGIGSHVTDLLSQMVTVGAIVVAYHMLRSLEVDYAKVAIIAAVGGVAWSLIAHFVPKRVDRGLEGLVRDALAPLVEAAPRPKAAATSGSEPSTPPD